MKSYQNLTDQIQTYNRFADLKRLQFIQENLRSEVSHGKILDVGCGNGIISLQLGRAGFNVKGIDVSDKAIEKAIKTNPFPNVVFEVTDAETLEASGEIFDAIICSEVLEHLQQPASLLKELTKVLKVDGLLIVTVPNGIGPRESLVTKPILHIRKNNTLWKIVTKLKSILGYSGKTIQSEADNLDHIQFFTLRALRGLAKETGFRITATRASNFIDDVFPISLLTRRLKFLQRWDSRVADLLPVFFSGGYLMVWKKQ